jgi:hypothetical protein
MISHLLESENSKGDAFNRREGSVVKNINMLYLVLW